MNNARLLIQIKECIKESKKRANPKKDKLFLVALEKLDKGADKKLKKLEHKEAKYGEK